MSTQGACPGTSTLEPHHRGPPQRQGLKEGLETLRRNSDKVLKAKPPLGSFEYRVFYRTERLKGWGVSDGGRGEAHSIKSETRCALENPNFYLTQT